MDEAARVLAPQRFNELWDALFPAEQARIVQPLFNTRAVELAGIAVDPRHHGVGALVREMLTPSGKEATA